MSWLNRLIGRLSRPQAPVTSTRTIGAAAHQPDANNPCEVSYTIQHVATAGQDGTVKLLSDASNPPTTERDECRLASTGGGTIAGAVRYIVPAGHYVKLVGSGNTTQSITQQVETPFASST